jgi:uncharacterized UBP type Zn finger protein
MAISRKPATTWIIYRLQSRVLINVKHVGDTWVHLRTCQTCGKVYCYNSSKNKHATKHFLQTGHPVVISAERGERWAWCYPDNTLLEY